jgi:hypothetical protein
MVEPVAEAFLPTRKLVQASAETEQRGERTVAEMLSRTACAVEKMFFVSIVQRKYESHGQRRLLRHD